MRLSGETFDPEDLCCESESRLVHAEMVISILHVEMFLLRMSEQQRKRMKPPSSYGSMKTDSDSDVMEVEVEVEELALRPQFVPEIAAPEETRY